MGEQKVTNDHSALREMLESKGYIIIDEFAEMIAERAEFKAEFAGELIQPNLDSPEIADTFIEDKLSVIREKLNAVNGHIQKNYVMRSDHASEIDEEISQEEKDLNHMRLFQIGNSKMLDDRRRRLDLCLIFQTKDLLLSGYQIHKRYQLIIIAIKEQFRFVNQSPWVNLSVENIFDIFISSFKEDVTRRVFALSDFKIAILFEDKI